MHPDLPSFAPTFIHAAAAKLTVAAAKGVGTCSPGFGVVVQGGPGRMGCEL